MAQGIKYFCENGEPFTNNPDLTTDFHFQYAPLYSLSTLPRSVTREKEKLFWCTCVVDVDSPFEMVKEQVFDLKLCENWNPAVEHVELYQMQHTGIGNRRKCVFYDGSSVDETIVRETNTVSTISLDNGASIMQTIGPELTIEKINDKKTRVISKIYYRPKGMPLTYGIACTIMKKQIGVVSVKHAQGKGTQ